MAIRSYQGKDPVIAPGNYIDPAALVLGKVRIGRQSSVWPMAVIRGDVNSIQIGDRTNIQDGSVLHVTHDGPYSKGGLPLIIGDDVTVGHNVTLHACTIANACLIGMGSLVLDGAVVSDYSIVAAGSLVPPGKTLESGYLWMGSPVKRIRPLSSSEKESILYSAEHYTRVAQSHMPEVVETVDDILPETHD